MLCDISPRFVAPAPRLDDENTFLFPEKSLFPRSRSELFPRSPVQPGTLPPFDSSAREGVGNDRSESASRRG